MDGHGQQDGLGGLRDAVRALVPVTEPLSCDETDKVYVLEVVEAGGKRRGSAPVAG